MTGANAPQHAPAALAATLGGMTMSIQFYLPRLSDDALDRLRALCERHHHRCPAFIWGLHSMLTEEGVRRGLARDGIEFREVELPDAGLFGWRRWTNAELGQALVKC